MKQRTLWQQRPHLIHLCSAFIYHSACVTHTRCSANMLWTGKLLHLFWKQAHLAKFLQDALVFVSTPKRLQTAIWRVSITACEKPPPESDQASELCFAALLVGAEGTEPWAQGPPSSLASRECWGQLSWVTPRVWPIWKAPGEGWEYCQKLGGEGRGRVESFSLCLFTPFSQVLSYTRGRRGSYELYDRGDSRGGHRAGVLQDYQPNLKTCTWPSPVYPIPLSGIWGPPQFGPIYLANWLPNIKERPSEVDLTC